MIQTPLAAYFDGLCEQRYIYFDGMIQLHQKEGVIMAFNVEKWQEKRAQRIGLTVEEYVLREAAGQRCCTRCLTWKAVSEFPPAKYQRDGINCHCRACWREQSKRYRPVAPEMIAPVSTLAETDKAWMAGFIDGEGYLGITKQVRKGRPSPAYRAMITVSNTRKDALELFVGAYGSPIYGHREVRKGKDNVNWAEAYSWYCPMARSEELLMDVRPYLRVKNVQADFLLEFIRNKQAFERTCWPGQGGGSAPLSAVELAYRERIRIAVQELNTKGPRSRMVRGASGE